MKVSIGWLKELVGLNVSVKELTSLIPLRTIGLKGVNENFIELDMKGYNRADLLSMRGVAFEIAAITDSDLNFSDEPETQYDLPKTNVEVKDSKLCPVYCIAKIENLKVKESPKNWVKKLSDSGLRSINNVADVTNLIMLEYGQPMHAFDASKVKEETLIVRTANSGEEIVTLDGKTRKLEETDLLITDPEEALGIAGVMGGKDSEVSDSTTTILLEAAIFDPVNLRKTAQKLGLTSEASKRFQHGLTKKRLLQALNAAIKMYLSLGGKLTAISFKGDLSDPVRKVKLTKQKLDSLVGFTIEPEKVEEYLKKLGFNTLASQGDAPSGLSLRPSALRPLRLEEVEDLHAWDVTVPYWRLDIEIEEDLIEEVSRMYGFEKIPAEDLSGVQPKQAEDPIFNFIYDLKLALKEIGLTEVQTYSFFSTSVLNNFEWDQNSLVKVANPISAETEYLREDIWPNLVEVIDKNLRAGLPAARLPAGRQGFEDIAVFEIGKVYTPGEKPSEEYRLSISLMNGSDNPTAELYKIFEQLDQKVGLGISVGSQKKGEYEEKYFHPTRFSFLEKDGEEIGGIAEVHPKHLDKFGINKRVAVLEILL